MSNPPVEGRVVKGASAWLQFGSVELGGSSICWNSRFEFCKGRELDRENVNMINTILLHGHTRGSSSTTAFTFDKQNGDKNTVDLIIFDIDRLSTVRFSD
ncbi:hypothetical protein GX48_07475 [Paracoccidioides brasiliensis]|nr:hypothetical protein GX48_07475 [Paracoccidioides brasiliensis]